jgi:hypothetical protein
MDGWKLFNAGIVFVLTLALLVFINAFLIEWTWNAVISTVFNVSKLTWFQSWQLGILGAALSGSRASFKSEK